MVDYAAFTFDASKTPSKVYFAGTLFETPIDGPTPVVNQSSAGMMKSMKEKGDIFRQPPPRVTAETSPEKE